VSGHLEVLATGPLATVQDLGRPGHAHWGVSWSGAADRASARLANRLVGNPEGEACLEITFGGLAVRALGEVEVALTGARCPASVDGYEVGPDTPFHVPDGAELRLAAPAAGLRTYLAVRGGIAVAPVLGSRATDVLGEVGPPVLSEGDRLPVGASSDEPSEVDQAAVRGPAAGTVELRVWIGPRGHWFTEDARHRLVTGPWMATPDSNRIGLRLDGPPLPRAGRDELPTEGMVRGSLQVPPSGPPTVLLADHPVTGGYPVIGVVVDADVDRAAQVRPGQRVHFRAVGGGDGDEVGGGGGR
jgi:biotin-dependent carboxylase-like uncharacterized protein